MAKKPSIQQEIRQLLRQYRREALYAAIMGDRQAKAIHLLACREEVYNSVMHAALFSNDEREILRATAVVQRVNRQINKLERIKAKWQVQ